MTKGCHTYYSLLTTYYLLLTTHYSVRTEMIKGWHHYYYYYYYYSLLSTHYSVLSTQYSLLSTHRYDEGMALAVSEAAAHGDAVDLLRVPYSLAAHLYP